MIRTLALCILFSMLASSAARGSEALSPVHDPSSVPTAQRHFRIGYLEASAYRGFADTMQSFTKAFDADAKLHVTYPPDKHFSTGLTASDEELRQDAQKLMQSPDLDLIIAMGTSATSALLAVNNHKTPILALAVADPVASKLIPSVHDSGVDNLAVHILPDRWTFMFSGFHEITHFKKLGVMYTDTPAGRTYTSLDDAREIARDRGFTLVEYPYISPEGSFEEVHEGLQWLIDQGIDAFFIPAINGFDWTQFDLRPHYALLNAHKVLTFAREGSAQVKTGALMGFSASNFERTGKFMARMAYDILTGTKPRDVNMIDSYQPAMALNFQTADLIGFEFPLEVLIAADEIFLRTVLPNQYELH